MTSVTLSSKYQISIPKNIRIQGDFVPGMKFNIIYFKGSVQLVPEQPIESFWGRWENRGLGEIRDKE